MVQPRTSEHALVERGGVDFSVSRLYLWGLSFVPHRMESRWYVRGFTIVTIYVHYILEQ